MDSVLFNSAIIDQQWLYKQSAQKFALNATIDLGRIYVVNVHIHIVYDDYVKKKIFGGYYLYRHLH